MDVDASEVLMALIGPGMRVLDLGCGDGRFLDAIARLVGRSGVIVGLDPSEESLATARRRTALNRNSGVDWADLRYGLSVAPGSFDVVLIHDSISSEAGPSALIPGTVQALRPGGTLGIVVRKETEDWLASLTSQGITITASEGSDIERGTDLVAITGIKKETGTP